MKNFFVIILALVLIPFVVKPSNVTELYAPFHEEQYLLAAAIMPEQGDRRIFDLSWPTWFIRFLVSQHQFDFSNNYENNQSTLQFILAAVFEHEKIGSAIHEIEYVFSIAQLSIDQGANIDNIADYGLSALHEAVLANSIAAATFLINNGADCAVFVSRPGKPIDGMSALEMATFLKTKDDKDRSEVITFLKTKKCDAS
jgi:hypothetical protein